MSYSKIIDFKSGVVVSLRWPDFKPAVTAKALRMQYVETDDSYTIFALDDSLTYQCLLVKLAASPTYPFSNYTPDYLQAQNDTDVAEFEASYKTAANSLIKSVEGLISFVSGYSSTASNSRVGIMATTYAEPLTDGQRSISSSSALDTSAGTGARTVLLTYYDNSMNGPLTETLTLNGTSTVDTVATNIRFVESMRVTTAGSQGNNQGTITLFNATAGGGGPIGTIALNDNQTNWCHHYIGAIKTLFLAQVLCGNQGSSAGAVTVLKTTPTVSNATDLVIIPQLRTIPGETVSFDFKSPVSVAGPARILLQIKQDSTSSTNNWFAGFSYQEV